jgi:monoamine oxidase
LLRAVSLRLVPRSWCWKRHRAVAAYRRQALPDRRVLLAGDYVAFPWTDGAAESGEWAAAELSRLVTSGADQR